MTLPNLNDYLISIGVQFELTNQSETCCLYIRNEPHKEIEIYKVTQLDLIRSSRIDTELHFRPIVRLIRDQMNEPI